MRKMKLAVVTLLGTACMSGCLGGLSLGRLWDDFAFDLALYSASEFLLDNDGVFDLWEDGNTAQ